MEILFLILLFIIVVFGFVFYAYNRLTRLRNVCETEWANIDVLLKQRADLIPNLIEVVRGYATHEQDVLETVSKARTEAALATGRKGKEEVNLSSHVKSILALREAYPDLKANQDFMHLQSDLFRIETEIAELRQNYNDIVKAHNDLVLQFPSSIVASLTGFSLQDLFEFNGTREAPRLNLIAGEDQVV